MKSWCIDMYKNCFRGQFWRNWVKQRKYIEINYRKEEFIISSSWIFVYIKKTIINVLPFHSIFISRSQSSFPLSTNINTCNRPIDKRWKTIIWASCKITRNFSYQYFEQVLLDLPLLLIKVFWTEDAVHLFYPYNIRARFLQYSFFA